MGICNFIEIEGHTKMYRPEAVILSPKESLSDRVEWMEYMGSIQRVTLSWNGQSITLEAFTKDMKSYPFKLVI